MAEDVEAAFRKAMAAWAYDAQWMLWEMGSWVERSRIGQNAFAERLAEGGAKPAAGRQVDDVRIVVHSETAATVTVRFGLERRPNMDITTEVAVFAMRLEDDRWRLPFSVFVNLAHSRAYPSPPQNPGVSRPSIFGR